MKIADGWKDYSVIATGDGYKLERWGGVILLRPDPQVIWRSSTDMSAYKSLNAKYLRSESGGVYSSFYSQREEKVNLDATEIMRILRSL